MFYGKLINSMEYGFCLNKNKLISYVTLTDIEHEELLSKANQYQKRIVPDENGFPILQDNETPSQIELLEYELLELKSYLESTDYIACKIAEGSATIEEYRDIIDKRKETRIRINEIEKMIN